MDNLTYRIQALPPELFDLILHLFFEVEPTQHWITLAYEPPVQLQINRYWRTCYAKSYFRITIFRTDNPFTRRRWLRSLSPEDQVAYAVVLLQSGPSGRYYIDQSTK